MHSVSLILKTKQIIKSYLNFSCVENMREKGSNKVVHVNGLRYGTKYHVLSFLHSFPLFRSLIQIMFIFFESLMTFDLRHWISFSNCKFVWCWILIKFGNTFYVYAFADNASFHFEKSINYLSYSFSYSFIYRILKEEYFSIILSIFLTINTTYTSSKHLDQFVTF